MTRIITRPLPALLLISVVAVVIYSNTFSAPFVFDDTDNIVQNLNIRTLSNFTDLSGRRYVGYLTFALNYHFGGLNVFWFHIVNLLIHIGCGFLVYRLVLLLFRAKPDPLSAHADVVALATALLFIAHPLQTQAVTYIVQRFASLAALFYVMAVVCYLKWRLGGRFMWYVASILSVILGMKTKEFVFTLPFMIALVEACFFARRKWSYLVPLFLTLPVVPFSRVDMLGEEVPLFGGASAISRLDYLFTQFRVIVTYLRLLVLPMNQNLDYDYPIYHSPFAPQVFASFLFLVTILAVAAYLLRSGRKIMAFGILWFFLTVSAESSVIPIQDVIFEHRLYLPSIGFFLAMSALAASAWERWQRMRTPLAAIGLFMFGALFVATWQRNMVWRDEATLWRDVVEKAPHKARGHNNLGNAYRDKGRMEEAVKEYRTALNLQPDLADAHYNLGMTYGSMGRWEEAIQEDLATLRLQPGDAMAHNNLGDIYRGQGRVDEAIRELETAIRLEPDYAEAHNNLGNMYNMRGHQEDAVREYQAAIRLRPELATAHYNMGIVLRNLGRISEARAALERALQIQPDFSQARQVLDALPR